MVSLGAPEKVTNIINRIDEFIWTLFIIYIIIINYKGNTWQFKKTNLDSIAIIFVFIGFISVFLNHNSIFWSSVAIFIALKGFFMFWIAKNMSIEKNKIILFFKIFIYILVFAALIGILQFLGINILRSGTSEKRFGVEAAQSIFGHHSTFGTLMAVGVALTAGLKICTGKNKWLFLSIILFLGLIASTVRRSLIGITLGTLFVMINYKKFRIPKKYTYSFLLIAIFSSIIFYGHLTKMTESTEYEYGNTIQPRYFLYYGALEIIKNKPFCGEGPGKYGSYISVLKKSEIYEKYNIIVEDRYKLDTYWSGILGEYGILGFLTIIFLLVTIFKSLLKGYNKENNTSFISGLYIGYMIISIDFIVESIASPVYMSSLFAFIFFVGIGLITGYKETSEII